MELPANAVPRPVSDRRERLPVARSWRSFRLRDGEAVVPFLERAPLKKIPSDRGCASAGVARFRNIGSKIAPLISAKRPTVGGGLATDNPVNPGFRHLPQPALAG